MSLLAASGTIDKTHDAPPAAVGAALQAVCRSEGHHLGSISPDQSRCELVTKRTAFNWGTAVVLTLAPAGSGTRVLVDDDTVPGARKALMDGRKNAKTVEQLIERLDASL